VKPLGLSLGQAVLRSCIKNRTLDFQISLWGKEWFWNISDCWKNYPHHTVDRDVWWYYITELSFYWGLFFSQFVDVRRKDFWVIPPPPNFWKQDFEYILPNHEQKQCKQKYK
jgi:hypothetical protein